MTRLAYDTDLSDDQWALIAPSLPAAKAGGRPRTLDLREVLNAIFYLLWNGIKWRSCLDLRQRRSSAPGLSHEILC